MLSSQHYLKLIHILCKSYSPILKVTSKAAIFQNVLRSQYFGIRCFLSEAYSCDDKWNGRLQDQIIKDIKPVEYYYELIRKFRKDGKVSAIDADIFFNSIPKGFVDDLADEMEEILRILRRSPETINTLPSSPHAVIRLYLEAKKYDKIFKIITDPMNYGVFLDSYSCDLLMNSFLKEKYFTGAARVASMLMQQEDFGPELTQSFCLLSCLKYSLNTTENEPWVDYHPHVEPEEEVKIIVRYIRNPYFDDHFDLKEPLHIVGKTLAWLSPHFKDLTLKANAEVLGWSLYEKWQDLIMALESLAKEAKIDEVVFNRVSNQVASCQDENLKNKINESLQGLKSKQQVSNFNIMEKAEQSVNECVKRSEMDSIKSQEMVYDSWVVGRKEAVEKQLELFERNRLVDEIRQKKEDLQKREDVIFFFDNEDKFELLLPQKHKYYPRRRPAHINKKKPRTVDTEYVPPEI